MYALSEKSCLFIINTLYHQTIFCVILFILILGLTFILKEKSPRWQLCLWFLILIRLILPTDLSLPFSARNLVGSYLSGNNFNISLEKISNSLAVDRQLNQDLTSNAAISMDNRYDDTTPASWGPEKDKNRPLPLPLILFVTWITGCLLSLYLFLSKIRSINRVVKQSLAVRDKKIIASADYWRHSLRITRPVKIVSSDKFRSPFTVGLFRPKIFIPDALIKDTDTGYETINSIIAHEMVHIKRFDHVLLRLQSILQIIYFFNPVVWYANSQINIARERLCDSEVLSRHVISPNAFGKSIIHVLKFNLSGYRVIEPLLCFGNHKKIFEYRIRDILKAKPVSRKRTFYIFLMACSLGLFLLPMSGSRTDARVSNISVKSVPSIEKKLQTPTHSERIAAEVHNVTTTGGRGNSIEKIIGQKVEGIETGSEQHHIDKERVSDQPVHKKTDPKNEVEARLPQVTGRPERINESSETINVKDHKNTSSAVNTVSIHEEEHNLPAEKAAGPEKVAKQASDYYRVKSDAVSTPQGKLSGKPTTENNKRSVVTAHIKIQTAKNPEKIIESVKAVPKTALSSGAEDRVRLAQMESPKKISPDAGNSKTEDADAYLSRGVSRLKKGQMEDAISDFNKAIELDPARAAAYIARGTVYFKLGRFDKAIPDYNKAIDINPHIAVAYQNRGSIYYRQGKFDKAISDYNKAIELNPDFASSYQDRASIYQSQGKLDKAISDYSKAIDINPKFAAAYQNRGNSYYSEGKYKKAISDYDKAIELDPKNFVSYPFRGNAYFKLGWFEKAISDYSKAIDTDPRFMVAYQNRGAANFSLGNYKKAISDYDKAIELDPKNFASYSFRGYAYFKLGWFEKAISDYNKAIELNPKIGEINDAQETVCRRITPLGSHIKRKVCLTRAQWSLHGMGNRLPNNKVWTDWGTFLTDMEVYK